MKCKVCGWPIAGNFCVNTRCGELAPRISHATSREKFKTFSDFKVKVDAYIMAELGGLNSDDLPDYDYYRAWDGGKSPETTAKAAIKAAKTF